MSIYEFYKTAKKLTSMKRAGWVERGVRDPESISDHSFMAAMLCMAAAPDDIDKCKAVKMALIHDLAESLTGDMITKENWPSGGTITEAEKHEIEKSSIGKILSCLEGSVSDEIMELWTEFEAGKTREARFVRSIDVAQRCITAAEYHKEGNHKKPLEPFWDERGLSKIGDERVKRLVVDIIPKGR